MKKCAPPAGTPAAGDPSRSVPSRGPAATTPRKAAGRLHDPAGKGRLHATRPWKPKGRR